MKQPTFEMKASSLEPGAYVVNETSYPDEHRQVIFTGVDARDMAEGYCKWMNEAVTAQVIGQLMGIDDRERVSKIRRETATQILAGLVSQPDFGYRGRKDTASIAIQYADELLTQLGQR